MISLDRARPYGHSDGFDVFPRGFSQGLVAILWRCIAENPAGNGRARGLGSGLGNLVGRLEKSPNTPEGALPELITDRTFRSEERRVGKEGVGTCRSGGSQSH